MLEDRIEQNDERHRHNSLDFFRLVPTFFQILREKNFDCLRTQSIDYQIDSISFSYREPKFFPRKFKIYFSTLDIDLLFWIDQFEYLCDRFEEVQ